MSGHSKWHNIRLKKGKVDAQRGKIFTKLSRDIYMAVRKGGADPETNFLLKVAVQRARAVNMPADNIKRVIEKASGNAEGDYEEVTYEGYGPHGVALIIEAATNNRNRTAADIRSTFSKLGGNLGETGCVSWNFTRYGVLTIPAEGKDEEEVLMAALDAGASDMNSDDENFMILTEPNNLHAVKDGMEKAGFEIVDVGFQQIAKDTVELTVEQSAGVIRLLETLEDFDDVQNVYSNADIPEEAMEE